MSITLHGQVADLVEKQVLTGGYQSAEDLVYEALQVLVKTKIDQQVSEGLADAEAGRVKKLNPHNIESYAKSIVAKAHQ